MFLIIVIDIYLPTFKSPATEHPQIPQTGKCLMQLANDHRMQHEERSASACSARLADACSVPRTLLLQRCGAAAVDQFVDG